MPGSSRRKSDLTLAGAGTRRQAYTVVSWARFPFWAPSIPPSNCGTSLRYGKAAEPLGIWSQKHHWSYQTGNSSLSQTPLLSQLLEESEPCHKVKEQGDIFFPVKWSKNLSDPYVEEEFRETGIPLHCGREIDWSSCLDPWGSGGGRSRGSPPAGGSISWSCRQTRVHVQQGTLRVMFIAAGRTKSRTLEAMQLPRALESMSNVSVFVRWCILHPSKCTTVKCDAMDEFVTNINWKKILKHYIQHGIFFIKLRTVFKTYSLGIYIDTVKPYKRQSWKRTYAAG